MLTDFYRAALNAGRSSDEKADQSVCLSVYPSVCLSVKRVDCYKTQEQSYHTNDITA